MRSRRRLELVRHVEAGHHDAGRPTEHDRGRFRVGPDVELGDRRCGCRTCRRPSARCRRCGRRGRVPTGSARAMLVSGPTGTSQIPSVGRHVSTMKRTASVPSSGVVGAGRSAPSSPRLAVDERVRSGSATSGRSLPEWTGTSMPSRSRITSALQVVRSSGAFPATVVMPTRSAKRAAAMMATASSWPGSQSSRIDGPRMPDDACARHDGEHAIPTCTLSGCARCPVSRLVVCAVGVDRWSCRPARAAASDDSADDAGGLDPPVTDVLP